MAANAIIARDFNMVEENITLDNVKILYLHLTNEMQA